jgi:hypothetical protein
MTEGSKIKFSVYVNGTLINSPLVIGIESFDSQGNWINESDSYITDISNIPEHHEVFYNCPKNVITIAPYLQCQEITSISSIDISLSNTSCVILPIGYKEPVKESESIWNKYIRLFIKALFFSTYYEMT